MSNWLGHIIAFTLGFSVGWFVLIPLLNKTKWYKNFKRKAYLWLGGTE